MIEYSRDGSTENIIAVHLMIGLEAFETGREVQSPRRRAREGSRRK